MHFLFLNLFLEKTKQNKTTKQTFLNSCDLVFSVKLEKLLKICLKSLPAVISSNVIEKMYAYFSCSSFTMSELWII